MAAALVEADAVGRVSSEGGNVGVAAVLAPAESFGWAGTGRVGSQAADGDAGVGVARRSSTRKAAWTTA